ncbi:MAG: hypothetical protein U1E20_00570 [Methylocystis sp.]|uniref:hypothetical protein n=1 Tax=Methylocystis sp. TaxID=1911079 RepID=UPI00393FB18A
MEDKRMFVLRLVVYAVILLASPVCSLTAQADSSPPYTNGVSVFVPFVNANEVSKSDASPEIRVGFSSNYNSSFAVTMDTGSVGIIVGGNYFTPPAKGRSDASFIGPGTETLTSSGYYFTGDWYRTTVHLFNDKTAVASATVPVMAVTNVTCIQGARDCHVVDHKGADVHYFGVGFAGGAGLPQGTPDKNAFLNVTKIAGSSSLPSPGYILSTQGALIGLTSNNTKGFALIKLEPLLAPSFEQWQSAPASPNVLTDWQHARGTITVNGVSGSGGILFDTGVNTGFLTPPIGVTVQTGMGPTTPHKAECNTNPPTCAVSGTTVQVSFPDQTNWVASLNYTVGPNNGAQKGNPVSPYAVSVDHTGAPFLNTTVRFLQGFNYLYDAANGFIGLKTTGATPPRYAMSAPGGLAVGGVFQCFFGWAEVNFGSRSGHFQATAYSWPYTYVYDPNNQIYIGVSSGVPASANMPAATSLANDVYVWGAGGPSTGTHEGALSGWLAAAGCQ